MKRLIVDVDDTILQCADTFQKFIGANFGLYSGEYLRNHHDIPKLFGVSIEKTMEIISAFHRSHLMANLPPLPCAADVLPDLYEAGYSFVAITACLDEPLTIERRKANLWAAFGFPWEAIHCIGLKPSKRSMLEQYPSSYWVDDLYHHAEAGHEVGHKSFLIDKPYNRHSDHPEITRVVDWHQIAEKLL